MHHQIRGSIVSYTRLQFLHSDAVQGVVQAIVDAYKEDGVDFVQKACSSNVSYLEDVAGLTKFRAEGSSMMDACMDWDEADSEDDF